MLELQNIYLSFGVGTPDETALFKGFSLTVGKGEFVSIVGSNGSGKTTLLNLVCGSLTPQSGRIIFAGQDITKKAEHARARRIGRVFQNPQKGTCGALTILENMALADNKQKRYTLMPGVNKKRTDYYKSLLEPCGMGLENRFNAQVGTLSGGQRQALALVIANMTDIDLLILDEHTAALDPRSSETIMEITKRVVGEKSITTLMVTHNLRFAAQYGTRLLMMHEGTAIQDICGAEKSNTRVEDLLSTFNNISIECGN